MPCFELIAGWIRQCKENHSACENAPPSPLPTRVIDVRCGREPRLYETHGEQDYFVALSHCWGKSQINTTTKATFEQRKQCIPFNSLSKTFQDAVTVTRQLRFSYLWIDSLCIIQDDLHDWEAQAAQMASIYHNADLTIAATATRGGNEGFLSERHGNVFQSLELPSCSKEEQSSRVYMRQKPPAAPHWFSYGNGEQPLYDFPLLGRGWVLQERILSRRVIHFTASEILWECANATHCECGVYDNGSPSLFKTVLNSEVPEDYWPFRRGRHKSTSEIWQTLVGFYSGLELSVETDRLPAISGLAKFVGTPYLGRYLAGLWEAHLPSELLWYIYTAKGRRPQGYIAPSWSCYIRCAKCSYSLL